MNVIHHGLDSSIVSVSFAVTELSRRMGDRIPAWLKQFQ